MRKLELVKAISEDTGVDVATVSAVVESFMKTVKGTVKKGDKVFLRHFATFTTKVRAPKKARIISKGVTIDVPAHTIPYMKPSEEWIDELR
jgi:DNA-binding protein HU-beta